MLWFFVSFSIAAAVVDCNGYDNDITSVRLSEKSDLTTALVNTPLWFREVFNSLENDLKLVYLYCDEKTRNSIQDGASGVDGPKRKGLIKRRLKNISDKWEERGLGTLSLTSKSSTFGEANRSETAENYDNREKKEIRLKSPSQVNSNMVDSGNQLLSSNDSPQLDSNLYIPSLWNSLNQHKEKSGTQKRKWLALNSENDGGFQWEFIGNESLPINGLLLPRFTLRSQHISDFVAVNLLSANISINQYLSLPDEFYRLWSENNLSSISLNTAIELLKHFSGDVSVTGKVILSFRAKLADEQMGLLVDTMLDKFPSISETKLMARVIANRWLLKLTSVHFDRIAINYKQCQLAGEFPSELVLAMSPETLADVVNQCQTVWLPNQHSKPLLGHLHRIWFTKMTESHNGNISQWSTRSLRERIALLTGALPEELDQLTSVQLVDSASSLSLVKLNRAQAQPVLDSLLVHSSLMTLYRLLRHIQPAHVRMIHTRLSELIEALPWIVDESDYGESASFATLLQIRMLLGDMNENITADNIYQKGKLFYTHSLHEVYFIYSMNITITSEMLHAISSPRIETTSARTLLSVYLLKENCVTCLNEVPEDLLSELSDSLLLYNIQKNRILPAVLKKLVSVADRMLIGKQATVFRFIRQYLHKTEDKAILGEIINFNNNKNFWSMATPTDIDVLIPFIIDHMKQKARENTRESMIKYAAGIPQKIVTKLMDYFLDKTDSKTWTTENFLGRGQLQQHGPWIYLSQISCKHIDAINPLDIVPIAEEVDAQLSLIDRGSMPVNMCLCLKSKLMQYLRLKHKLLHSPNDSVNTNITRNFIEKSNNYHLFTKSESFAIPPCLFTMLPRSFLVNHPKEIRLLIWTRVAQMKWPQILQHLLVQNSYEDYVWVADRLIEDMDIGVNDTLNFAHLLKLNQMLHFINSSMIKRIEPPAFKSWIYSQVTPEERLVCRPHEQWSHLIQQAFGRPHNWVKSTAYYLGSWIFALNTTSLSHINRMYLRLSLDNLLQSLSVPITDTISEDHKHEASFIASCKKLGDSSIDLRLVFNAAMLSGVVGSPRYQSLHDENALNSEDVNLLSQYLHTTLDSNKDDLVTQATARNRIGRVLRKMSNRLSLHELQQKHMSYDFWSDQQIHCEDLRSADWAAVAITSAELKKMASKKPLEFWSCLHHLGKLDWSISDGTTPADVWEAARSMNKGVLSPNHVVNLGNTISYLTPKELSNISIWLSSTNPSLDVLSILGSQDWNTDQMNTIITTVMGITDTPTNSTINIYSKPDRIVAMGSILCGLSRKQINQLFNATIEPHLYSNVSASIGRILQCADKEEVVSSLAALAVQEFGSTSQWNQLHVETVGVVLAGLTESQWRALPPSALYGLQPRTARALASANTEHVARLNVNQLSHIGAVTARELQAHSGLDKGQLVVLEDIVQGHERGVAASTETPASKKPSRNEDTYSTQTSSYNLDSSTASESAIDGNSSSRQRPTKHEEVIYQQPEDTNKLQLAEIKDDKSGSICLYSQLLLIMLSLVLSLNVVLFAF